RLWPFSWWYSESRRYCGRLLAWRRFEQRQADREGAALARTTFHAHAAPMQGHNLFDHREADAGPADLMSSTLPRAIVALEHVRLGLLGDANSLVDNRDTGLPLALHQPNGNRALG